MPRNRRPARLQWQLVRAYTLSLTLLVAGLEIVLFAMIFLPTACYLFDPQLIVREALEGAVEAAPLLDADPPRLAELTAALQAATGEIVAEPHPPVFGLMFYFQGPPWTYVAVADEQGVVLANSPASAWKAGQPLAPQLDGADAELLRQAASGQPAWRTETLPPQGVRTIIAAPILTTDQRRVGILLVRHEVPFDWWVGVKLVWSYLAPSLLMALLLALAVGLFVGWIGGRGIVRRFASITSAATSWSRGSLQERIPPLGYDELGQVGRQLNQMAQQLGGLLDSQREYAATEERAKLARDLHDTVKQQVFAAALELAAVQAQQPAVPEAAGVHLARAAELVHQVQADLTAIVAALRTGEDQPEQDLPSLLRGTLAAWSKQTGVTAELACDPIPCAPWALALPLVRILQGVLANTARHAQATHVMVELRLDREWLSLRIEDNGRGFRVAPELLAEGGLAMLRERAASLPGGKLDVQSIPGAGTKITAGCRFGERSRCQKP